MDANESEQKQHFNSLAELYESHYADPYSYRYYEKLIFNKLIDRIDLKGKKVLDAMCGPGQASHLLQKYGALVTGLDISDEILKTYKNHNPACATICASMLETKIPDASFDIVLCVGGLHHLHPHVPEAIREVHRILKPNGYFCFAEPHSTSLFDRIRRAWYRMDSFFTDAESSLPINDLEKHFQDRFICKRRCYEGFGYFGYFFVFSSMVLRIPPHFKKYYAPLFIAVESVVSNFQTELFSLGVIAQWQKIPSV